MKTSNISLDADQHLQDKLTHRDIGEYRTLIKAGTGVGKSTFIAEHWTTKHKVLMLVPLAGQIRQLQEKYKSNKNMVFLAGKLDEKVDLSQHQGKHIFATYDKFSRLQKAINFTNYTLVVDEFHKLYSAGSYRDDALNPILDVIGATQKTIFGKQLLMTATYTPELAKLANIQIDECITASQNTSIQKVLTTRLYEHSWSYHWLKYVLERLENLKASGEEKIILIRLNACSSIEKAAKVIEDNGFKVLSISSKTMLHSPIIKQALDEQHLPEGFNVILTTSILDEAINFNDKDDKLDSVHIVNASAHPEEIIQFMGRLRKANPPFFLHLNKDENFLEPLKKEVDEDTADRFSQIEKAYRQLMTFADACKVISSCNILFPSGNKPESFVKVINTTFKESLGCPILRYDNHRITANKAGMMAACYRLDLMYTYQRFTRLEHRLNQLLPSLQIRQEVIKDKADSSLDKMIERVDAAQKALRSSAVIDVHAKVTQEQKPNVTLKEFGCQKRKLFDADPYSTANPYDLATHPIHRQVYFEFIELTQYLEKLADVHDAVKNDLGKPVKKMSTSYEEDVFFNNIRELLDFTLNGAPTVTVNLEDAEAIVEIATTDTIAMLPPFRAIIEKKPRHGISIDPATQKICIDPHKAMNLIKRIGDTDEKYSNAKHTPKRVITLKGSNWRGYTFLKKDKEIYQKKQAYTEIDD